MIIKTNKILSKKATISYLEIFTIIISLFAFCYLISMQSESVSAQEEELVCCEETKSGLTCVNAAPSICSESFKKSPQKCEEGTEFCEIGCCISNTNGLCSLRASKRACIKENGSFFSNPLCNIEQCKQGCCILGDQAKWTTEKNCKFLGNSQNKDIPTQWKIDSTTNSEIKCLYSVDKEKKGACVYKSGDERKCIFTTLYDCVARTGSETNFDMNGSFCSNPTLNTTCKTKDHKGCLENDEDVYWFDSCGNPENVAEDCTYKEGNYCGKVGTSYQCKDVNCVVDGVKRRNGESWCEYDGAIGVDKSKNMKDRYGRDTVGSRQVKHICYMGSERIQPCSDYRNEICVQSDTSTLDGIFAQAACRTNNWRQCMSYNSKKGSEDMVKTCDANPDCFVKEIDMVGGFHFKVCLPTYPPGFNLDTNYTIMSGVEVPSSSEALCAIATQRCTETWICGIFGCICVDSCKCHTSYFTEKMNEFCISLGDCGAYVNYVGEFTDGGYTLKSTGAAPPRGVNSAEYKKNAIPIPGQKADPGSYEFFETLNPETLTEITETDNESIPSNLSAFQQELLGVSGAMGSSLLLKILSENLDEDEASEIAGGVSSKPINYGAYYNAYSAIKSSISSQIVYKEKKAGGFEMIGALIAGMIAYLITQSILITLLAAMLAFLFFMAWIMYVHIDFTCDTWEVPSGGKDCNKCNKMEVPCSEYRCRSLGANCEFINKGTPNELCVARPENKTAPKISPLLSVITNGYKYNNIKDNGFEITTSDGNCIDAFTTVRFGIKIDPFAKCRFGIDPKQTFEEMPEKFGVKGNSILPVHRMDMFFPSPEAVKNRYNLTDEQVKQLGEVKFYVKCKTADGVINPEPYIIKSCVNPGPDRTAPVVSPITTPYNKGYIKYGEVKQDLMIYVNEPSECRWSHTPDLSYDNMENQMSCNPDIHFYSFYGLPCNATLTGLNNQTIFYIKCKDLSENSNIMTEDFIYEISPSTSPLKIIEVVPRNGEIITEGVQPVSVVLKAITSGGAENGVAVCSWEGNGYTDRFKETNSTTHKSSALAVRSGLYNIKFTCEDAAGNVDENITSFRILIDNLGPEIIRVYNEGGLKLFTNENAECRYETKLKYEFENATPMSSVLSKEHYGQWEYRKYYIQCKDEYNNPGGRLIIRPSY